MKTRAGTISAPLITKERYSQNTCIVQVDSTYFQALTSRQRKRWELETKSPGSEVPFMLHVIIANKHHDLEMIF